MLSTHGFAALQSEPWHSQEGEDKFVFENFFYAMRGGVFLEMGAIDGVVFSNTLWLAKAAGWRGLLIEPSPGKLMHLKPGAYGPLLHEDQISVHNSSTYVRVPLCCRII